MTHRISRRAIACALLATTCLYSPAHAQNAGSETMPRNRQELDENGVNWATGEQVNYRTDVSIGPDGPGGLRYVRAQGWGIDTSNYSMTMSGTAGVGFSVVVGQRTITFNYNGSAYVPDDGSGATFVVNSGTQYTLTLDDGTVIVYQSFGIYDNAKARVTSVTYPAGERLTFAYNTIDWCTTNADVCPSYGHAVRLQSISSPLGYQLHFTYGRDDIQTPTGASAWKRLASVTAINTTVDACDPQAGTCTTTQSWPTATYDTTGGVTLPDGNRWVYLSGTSQFTIKRPSAASANFVVNLDANNRVSSVVRDGMTWNYSFTPGTGTMTAVRTDPLGHQKTVVSDTNVGLPTSITDELGHVTTRTYNSSKQLTQETLPEGNYTHYAYDGRGNVTEVRKVAKSGSGLADIVTTASYPSTCANAACNQPTNTTDVRGNVTDYVYNADGTVQSIMLPAPMAGAVRPQTRYTYTGITTPGGTVVSKLQTVSQCQSTASCSGTTDETKATYSWSSQLLLTGVTKSDGTGALSATTASTYDNAGNLKTVDGPLAGSGDTATLRYDLMRRLVGTITPDPDGSGPLKMRAVRTTYNADGNVSKVELGTVNSTSDPDWTAMSVLQTASVGYDSAARAITKSLAGPDGVVQSLTQLSYDGESRLQCTAVRMNPAAFTALPADACTLSTQGGSGPDRISKTIYDAADRVTQQRVAVGTTDEAAERTLVYTNNGVVGSVIDGENNRTDTYIDGFDRLGVIFYPSATKGAGVSNSNDTDQFAYDANGNVTVYLNRNAQRFYLTYDNLNRLTSKSGAVPQVNYSYDNLGRMLTATFASGGLGITNTFDALSRVTSTSTNMTGTAQALSYQYDLAGRRTQLTYPDGHYLNYDHLVTGEVTAVRLNGVTSIGSYAYDNLGNRISLTNGDGSSTSYSYDAVNRLASLQLNFAASANNLTKTFAYDAAFGITSETRSNDAYAWNGAANTNRPYAANGLNQYTTAGPASYTYDANGNLTSDGTNSFAYDAENHLTSATVNGVATTLSYDPLGRLWRLTSGATDQRYVYDGGDMVAVYNGSALGADWMFGPRDDEPLAAVVTGTSPTGWNHADERGSIIARTDGSGNVNLTQSYDEYGIPGSTNATGFQYTGQLYLPQLGMYYYKARMYSTTLGRFMQRDPIGYADGLNWYAYAHDDPVNGTDPWGLRWVGACAGVKGGSESCAQIWIDDGPGNYGNRDNSLVSPGERNGADDNSQPAKYDPVAACKAKAVFKGLGNAGLDALGAIPGEAAAAVVIRAGVTSIQAAAAALNASKVQGALTATGFSNELAAASIAGAQARGTLGGLGKAIAKGVPYIGWGVTAVSLGKDAYDAYNAYRDCNRAAGK